MANDGTRGLLLIQTHNPDLVISDFEMPEMCGDEMLMRGNVRRSILVSGKFSSPVTESAILALFPQLAGLPPSYCTFMAKPVNFDKLLEAVSKMLANPVE